MFSEKRETLWGTFIQNNDWLSLLQGILKIFEMIWDTNLIPFLFSKHAWRIYNT